MSSLVETQAARRLAPAAGVAIACTTGASAGTDLSAYVGQFLTFKFSVKTHVRFAASAPTAVTTDYWLAADESQDFFISTERAFVATYATAASPVGVAAPTGG